jgi:hypothetical protein
MMSHNHNIYKTVKNINIYSTEIMFYRIVTNPNSMNQMIKHLFSVFQLKTR